MCPKVLCIKESEDDDEVDFSPSWKGGLSDKREMIEDETLEEESTKEDQDEKKTIGDEEVLQEFILLEDLVFWMRNFKMKKRR